MRPDGRVGCHRARHQRSHPSRPPTHRRVPPPYRSQRLPKAPRLASRPRKLPAPTTPAAPQGAARRGARRPPAGAPRYRTRGGRRAHGLRRSPSRPPIPLRRSGGPRNSARPRTAARETAWRTQRAEASPPTLRRPRTRVVDGTRLAICQAAGFSGRRARGHRRGDLGACELALTRTRARFLVGLF
jgi:hypothetical protein